MVHIRFPEFDRCSGDLRLSKMLRLLARRNRVALHILHKPTSYIEAPENDHYLKMLRDIGVEVRNGSLRTHLRQHRYDAVLIEFWFVARHLLNDIRALQPGAQVIVDTEHVHFYFDALEAKLLRRDANDIALQERKREELQTYANADLVITTTEEDKEHLLREDRRLAVWTIPNIHDVPPLNPSCDANRKANSLIFVGNFANNPSNVDAMIYFCTEILPLIRRRIPDASLSIVGNHPPQEVRALAGDHVTVTGYVPDTAPYLAASMVSVCPLRFGAGLKGKVGEAMMHAVPVVTTSIGTQGMDATHAQDVMVADTPDSFAHCVVRLLQEPALWKVLSRNGRELVARKYSSDAIASRVDGIVSQLDRIPVKRYGASWRLALKTRFHVADLLDRHVRWRFKRAHWNRFN